MNKNGHLETYKLTVTTRAPLFIGSGKACAKTDYVLSPDNAKILRLDQRKLFALLANGGLADKYETFILNRGTDMRSFLMQTCGLTWPEVEKLALYSVHSRDALDERHSLKNILLFNRDASDRPFIPGSSIKGALRTAYLYGKISSDGGKAAEPFGGKLTKWSTVNEAKYINTLQYANDSKGKTRGDMVSSIFRGVMISDSLPIDQTCMMLTDKIDIKPDGTQKKLNVCRECVKPDTDVTFMLTLDRSVVGNAVTPVVLLDALNRFAGYYIDTYFTKWKIDIPFNDADHFMLLGGGAGFFSKTLAYPLYGSNAGKLVQDFMTDSFRKHKHEEDMGRWRISPHTMKYAAYNGRLYLMGLCEVNLE